MNTRQAVTVVHEMRQQLKERQQEFAEFLGPQLDVKKFSRVASWSVQLNPKLAQCSTQSIVSALQHAAKDGLYPDGHDGVLIPYEMERPDGRRELVCQWLVKIQGMRKKVYRTGKITKWEVQVVQEGDLFEYQLGTNPFISHKPSMTGGRNRPVIAAYSIATFPSGDKVYEVMNHDQIEDVRKRASRSRHGPWSDAIYYPEMCRKTVARLHSKQLPMPDDVVAMFQREDETFGPDFSDQHHEPMVAKTTRAALEQFAPKPEARAAREQSEALREAPADKPESKAEAETKPKQPKNVDEYWKYYIRSRDAATTPAAAKMLADWFASNDEKKLRAVCHVGFDDLDQLESDLKAHISKVEIDNEANGKEKGED